MRQLEVSSRASRARASTFTILAWATLSLITAVVGPFSTFETMSIEFRMLYWGGIIGSAVILSDLVRRFVARFETPSPLHADLIGSALMAPSFGLTITVFNALALGHDGMFGVELGMNVLVVLLVCFGVVVFRAYIRHHVGERGVAELPASSLECAESLPGFLRDLDPEIRNSFRWIEADDHYLNVHAPSGSARVLKRFRDALDELSELPGLRVHRSHWVMIDAVTEVRPDGRRHVAVLLGGSEVPVSRSYLADLQSAGLLSCGAASAQR
jgi:hypothetical protein